MSWNGGRGSVGRDRTWLARDGRDETSRSTSGEASPDALGCVKPVKPTRAKLRPGVARRLRNGGLRCAELCLGGRVDVWTADLRPVLAVESTSGLLRSGPTRLGVAVKERLGASCFCGCGQDGHGLVCHVLVSRGSAVEAGRPLDGCGKPSPGGPGGSSSEPSWLGWLRSGSVGQVRVGKTSRCGSVGWFSYPAVHQTGRLPN